MITFQDILTAEQINARTYILLRTLGELNYYFSVNKDSCSIVDSFLDDMFNSLEIDEQDQVRDFFKCKNITQLLKEAFSKYDDRWNNE